MRHVGPTPDGEAHYASCLRLIADLEEAEGALRGARPCGPLHVGVQATLAGLFVVPHPPEFLVAHPEIRLLVNEGDRCADLLREGVDCVLRVGRLPDGELVVSRCSTRGRGTRQSRHRPDRVSAPERPMPAAERPTKAQSRHLICWSAMSARSPIADILAAGTKVAFGSRLCENSPE